MKPENNTENTAGSDCQERLVSRFFTFRQNNSGGSFDGPAVNVIIEAPDMETACKRTEPHFTLCGESGLYAEYDSCGCCPCCGHRWSKPWDDDGETPEELLTRIDKDGLKYPGGVSTALVKADGSITVGDSAENLAAIREFISSANDQGDGRRDETPPRQ
jgi:hypothetical protein